MNNHYINKPSHLGVGKKNIIDVAAGVALSTVICTSCFKSKDPMLQVFGVILAVYSAAETFSELKEI